MSVKTHVRRGVAALLLSSAAMATVNLPSAGLDNRVGDMPAQSVLSAATQKLGVSVGDDLGKVREVFATQIEVQPYHSGSNQNASTLRLRTKGVWFFFDEGGRITTIRLDAPFGDDIAGVRIKDRRDALVQTRGEPIRKWQVGANEAYLYPLDDLANVRYDINKAGEIETIFLGPAIVRSSIPSAAPATTPELALAFEVLGRTNLGKGDYDRAIRNFDQAIVLDHGFAAAFVGRGEAYRLKGIFELAVKDFDEAIRLDSNSAWAFNNRGTVKLTRGEYEAALEDYEHAILIDPKEAVFINNRGVVHLNKKETDRAMQYFDLAISLNPAYAVPYSNRGEIYRQRGEFDHAIADFDQAIRLNPKYAAAYNNRGVVFLEKGQYDAALNDFDEAIRLIPNYSAAIKNRDAAVKKKAESERPI